MRYLKLLLIAVLFYQCSIEEIAGIYIDPDFVGIQDTVITQPVVL